MPTRSLMRAHATTETVAVPRALSSRHFLKLIEDTGKVGFWSADLGGERLDASLGLYRILGLDPATEMTFGLVLGMLHPEDRAEHGVQIGLLRSGQQISREFRIIRPDRTQRWILHHAEAVFGSEGRPVRGMGVVFDVTVQHENMSAIIQHQHRLDALVAATASVFWILNANGELSEMQQWMALTGQTHSQVRGLGWLDAVHPDDRERTQAAWAAAVEHTAPYNIDQRVLCADGAYRWFNARGAPVLNKDGSVREWVGVYLNVPGRSHHDASRSDAPSSAKQRPSAMRRADVDFLTAGQIRAARSMVNLSKEELARLAKVSVSSINRLEDPESAHRPRPDTVQAVRRALERVGIEFILAPGAKPGILGL